YIAARTQAFLEDHAREHADQPFFLRCSFPGPRHPFTPPGEYWDRYAPQQTAVPATCHAPNPDTPPHVRRGHEERTGNRAALTSPRLFAVDDSETREILALTYGMISMVDDAVGRILDTLQRTGLADNAIVIFTSDHGDFMGDHGLMLKGPIHYQGLIRVPFIWSDPGDRTAIRTQALGSSIDIARTVLARAGLAGFNGMQGRTLLPVMQG